MAKTARRTQTAPRDDDRTPFLRPEDIRNGDIVVLSGFTRHLTGRFGEQIAVEVTHNRTGRTFDWAFKVGGEVHRRLFKQLGADEKKWRGTIALCTKSRAGMTWIDVQTVDSDNPPFDPSDIGGEPTTEG